MTPRRSALLTGCAVALFALVAATVPSLAQDATPVPDATVSQATPVAEATASQEATPTAAEEVATARPVHIHSGDCASLGEVVAPLTDLSAPTGNGVGQATLASRAEGSYTNVPMTLDAILGSAHAINVHLSADQIGTYIACGEIGGVIDVNGALSIGLREQNSSGFTGIAFLQPGADGLSTDVSVFISPVFGAAG